MKWIRIMKYLPAIALLIAVALLVALVFLDTRRTVKEVAGFANKDDSGDEPCKEESLGVCPTSKPNLYKDKKTAICTSECRKASKAKKGKKAKKVADDDEEEESFIDFGISAVTSAASSITGGNTCNSYENYPKPQTKKVMSADDSCLLQKLQEDAKAACGDDCTVEIVKADKDKKLVQVTTTDDNGKKKKCYTNDSYNAYTRYGGTDTKFSKKLCG